MSADSLLGSFLLYINGVRVPASSASVSIATNSPAYASVQVPANPILYGLGEEDLLQAAIFYLDTIYHDTPTYCLLFEGRLTGQTYSNNPMSETMALIFESNLNILGDLNVNFVGGKNSNTRGSRSDKTYPNQINVKGKGVKHFLSQGLSGRQLARPFDLLENIFLAVLGEYRDKSKFETILDRSLNTELEKQNSISERLLESRINRSMAVNGVSRSDSDSYDWLVMEVEDEYRQELVGKALTEGITLDPSVADSNYKSVQEAIIAEQVSKSVRDKAVNYRDIVISGFYSRHMRLTRFLEHWICSPYLEGIPNSDNPLNAALGGGVFPIFRSKKAAKYIKSIAKQSGAKFGQNGSVHALLSNIFGMCEYKFGEILAPPAMTVDKYSLPNKPFYTMGSLSKTSREYSTWAANLKEDGDSRVCIASYFTAPLCPHAIPPSCNVIFPSTRSSLDISHSYKDSPTRVYYNRKSPYGRLDLKSKSPGHNYVPTKVGYPSVAVGHVQAAAESSSNDLEFLIFPEEYYRGPKPTMQQVHPSYMDIQKYANAARFGAPESDKLAVASVSDGDPETLNHAVKAAEKQSAKGYSSYGLYFLLAQKAYHNGKGIAKQGTVSSMFNPYLIAGMPCAIMSGDNSGFHFYGFINQITHTLTASGEGWGSSVICSHMRSFTEVLQGIETDGANLDMYPQEPISEIRDLLQVNKSAEEYYKTLLHRDSGYEHSTATGQIDNVLSGLLSELKLLVERQEDLNIYITNNRVKFDNGSLSTEESDKYTRLLVEFEQGAVKLENVNSQITTRRSATGEDTSEQYNEHPSAFDFKSFLGWKRSDNTPADYVIMYEGDKKRWNDLETENRKESIGFQPNRILVPLPETRTYFDSTIAALKYNSRPVCTLEQYIDFYAVAGRGDGNIDPIGRGRGIRVNRQEGLGKGVFYDVIRQFVGGPGVEPGSTISGKAQAVKQVVEANAASSIGEEGDIVISEEELSVTLNTIGEDGADIVFAELKPNTKSVLGNLPDSRKDWQALLLDYLAIIEGRHPTRRDG